MENLVIYVAIIVLAGSVVLLQMMLDQLIDLQKEVVKHLRYLRQVHTPRTQCSTPQTEPIQDLTPTYDGKSSKKEAP